MPKQLAKGHDVVIWQTAIAAVVLLFGCKTLPRNSAAALPQDAHFTNSIGMKFVRIEPGSFMMGQAAGGDWDERPVHKVTITRPFYLAVTEVTNAQYERFDPDHRRFRGRWGLSKNDDEAVIFVNWHQAVAFCRWLSKKDGLPYRLPTEAEWEYACRASTTTDFATGNHWPRRFHKHQQRSSRPHPVSLQVGQTTPNRWGLYDMHGNVEEWCLDWYGPYHGHEQVDPVGRIDGDFRVARGGSHNTAVRYLRSANRMGTLPQDRHWLLGFRVAIGSTPDTRPLPKPKPPLWAQRVRREKHQWTPRQGRGQAYFIGPKPYVKVPPGSTGPMFSRHNHDPGLTWCDNGDILAIWYSCLSERGRELCVLASRLRRGASEWDPAAPFWDAPDRNDHAPALLNDGRGVLYHFNGLSAGAAYRKNLALIMRTSTDNGATWSKARLINPTRGLPSQPIASTSVTREGYLILPSDWPWHEDGPATALWISRDRGKSWQLPGGRIAGIHAGVAQREDGSLIALGRKSTIDGKMPMSISADMGKTWTYRASEFPPIGGGQRLVLLRLREGPLLLISFARSIAVSDGRGGQLTGSGLFAAASYDGGKTWPVRRLVTDGLPPHTVEAMDGRKFTMSRTTAEPMGYLAGVQSPDGIIHLISSKQYYAFNLAWLEQGRQL